MNKQIYDAIGVTEEEYKEWCKKNSLPSYKKENKVRFFELIRNGSLVRDRKTGKIVNSKR